MFEARLTSSAVLKKVLDAIKDLLNEATFDCSDSGIQVINEFFLWSDFEMAHHLISCFNFVSFSFRFFFIWFSFKLWTIHTYH